MPEVIRRRPEHFAHVADSTLVNAERIGLQPVTAPSAEGCRRLTAASDGSARFELPPGGVELRARGGATRVFLHRYGPAPGAPVGRIEADTAARLAAPADGDPTTPWTVHVTPAAAVTTCTAG